MECVTRVFYNDRPPNSHPFCVFVCVCASLHLCPLMQCVCVCISFVFNISFPFSVIKLCKLIHSS